MAIKRRIKDTSFKGVDLNETTVQNLFNHCLATKESTDLVRSYFVY